VGPARQRNKKEGACAVTDTEGPPVGACMVKWAARRKFKVGPRWVEVGPCGFYSFFFFLFSIFFSPFSNPILSSSLNSNFVNNLSSV
jgi:hypothetical protein